ncbi:hypothetical protein H0A73_10745 [Alcaligenaceae bacterium]|nr:hypothetical protein [Alcaligenaceae bacterium]
MRELMRLDGELALDAARRRRGEGTAAGRLGAVGKAVVPAMVSADAAPRLIGIYGVGKRLFAEVRSGEQAFLFVRGNSLPLGHVAGDGLYRLKELAGSCIRLERKGNETLLCLSRGGRQ